MTIRPRRLPMAGACLLGMAMVFLCLVVTVEASDKGKGWAAVSSSLSVLVIAMFFLAISTPQLLKPWVIRLTPAGLEISRTFTVYRIPWDEVDDVDVATGWHLPFMKVRTEPPRQEWLATMERRSGNFDIGVYWWEAAVPMVALGKLMRLYATEKDARAELADPAKVALRLESFNRAA